MRQQADARRRVLPQVRKKGARRYRHPGACGREGVRAGGWAGGRACMWAGGRVWCVCMRVCAYVVLAVWHALQSSMHWLLWQDDPVRSASVVVTESRGTVTVPISSLQRLGDDFQPLDIQKKGARGRAGGRVGGRVCVCVCVCVCVRARGVRVYACVRVRMRACMCARVYVRVRVRLCVCTHACRRA